jgi:O-antigen/teichoic acid export membrane protein
MAKVLVAAQRPLQVILRNAVHLVSETVLLQALSLVSGMLLTRHLQASGYGQYAFSYVFSWFLLLAMNLGTKGVILRDIPRHRVKAGHYLVQVCLLRSLTAVVAVAIGFLAGWYLDKPTDVRAAMVLFMLLAATDAIALTFVEIFRGLENMGIEAWLYVTERVAVVIGVWVAAKWNWGLVAIVQMMYGAALIRTAAWLIPIHRRLTLPPVTIDWPFWRYLVTEGTQYLRVDLATAMVQRLDVMLLGVLATAADTGRYNAAYTVYTVATVLPQMLANAMQPTSARLWHEAPDDLIPTQVRVASLTMLLAMPVLIGVGACAPIVMRLLFGPGFEEAGLILRWLTLALPVVALTGFVANHFFATDRQDLTFRVVAVNAALNLTLNLVMIPRWGAYGAVVATVISEVVGLGALIALSRHSIGGPLLKSVLPVIAIGILAYGVAISIAVWHPWLAVLCGWGVFAVVSGSLGMWPKLRQAS